MNTTRLCVLGAVLACAWGAAAQSGEPKRGGLVLQFDDGWSAWRTEVAPQLARYGAKASGFVNNQNIHSGRIGFADLRALQDEFGWEIGCHTYNHLNAVRFVQQRGMDAWLNEQMVRAVGELKAEGLRVQDFVFPFNAYSPELSRAVLDRGMGSYRRADPLALADGRREDGSLPGTSIDLSRYVPLAVLKQWVDLAHTRGQLLFLYGHRVLPDSAFARGRVASVTAQELVADADVTLPSGDDVVLVPDASRRSTAASVGGLSVADGRRIRISETGTDLTRLTAPGAEFLIGSSYGTRLSEFTNLIEYAAQRLTFYTVAEVVAGKK